MPSASAPTVGPFSRWVAALVVGDQYATEAKKTAPTDLRKAREWLALAVQCYEAGLKLAPENAEVSYQYGIALREAAEWTAPHDLREARELWRSAGVQYSEALRKNPSYDDVADSWGLALADEAEAIYASDLPLARKLWERARELYARALTLRPDRHGSANNWGVSLMIEARAVAPAQLAEAQDLWTQSRQQFARALKIKPDKYNALSNWGSSLADEAEALAKRGMEKPALECWNAAERKYAESLRLNPQFRDALYGLGTTLLARSRVATDLDLAQRRGLRQKADGFLAESLRLYPKDFTVAMQSAILAEVEAKALGDNAPLQQWDVVRDRYRRVLTLKPDSEQALGGLAACLGDKANALAKSKAMSEAGVLWREAEGFYAQSLQEKPILLVATNWGVTLRAEAAFLRPVDATAAQSILERAKARFAAAHELFPAEVEPVEKLALCWMDEFEATPTRGAGHRLNCLHRAQEGFEIAARLNSADAVVWGEWGRAFFLEAATLPTNDRAAQRVVLERAVEKLTESVRLDPRIFPYRHNLAASLHELGRNYEAGDHARGREFFARAEFEAEQALGLPDAKDSAGTRMLLATSFSDRAASTARANAVSARGLFHAANEHFSKVGRPEALSARQLLEWASARANEASALATTDLGDARLIWDDADAKFAAGVSRAEDRVTGLMMWAGMLLDRAHRLADSDLAGAQELWRQAREKYAEGAALAPGDIRPRNGLGVACLREYAAVVKSGSTAASDLLDQAEKAMMDAEQCFPGSASYNLACVYAWRQNPAQCVVWLDRCQKAGGLPDRALVLNDPFLKRVSTSPEFERWRAAALPGP